MPDLFVMLNWKIAAMIAKECSDDEEPPVVYVSGEEVCF